MQEASNWFQSFLTNSVDAFLECDRQKRYQSINPIAATWLQLNPEEMIGKTPQDLLQTYPDRPGIQRLISQIDSCLQQALLTGEKNLAIHEVLTEDGQIKLYETAYTPVSDDTHQIVRVFAVGREILSRDRTSQPLVTPNLSDRQSLEAVTLERSRLTTLTADVGIALTRHPQDILHPCCDAIVEHLDATSVHIWIYNFSEQLLELQASAGTPLTKDELRRIPLGQGKIGLIAQNQQPEIDSNFATAEFQVAANHPEKQPANPPQIPIPASTANFAGYPLIVEDQLVGVLAIIREQTFTDTTLEMLAVAADVIALGIERKRAEAELKAARAFLNSVVENLPLGIFAKDAESLRFVLWNKAGETIAGFTSQEIVGKSDYDVFPKEQAEVIIAQDREVLAHYQSPYPIKEILEEPIQTPHKGLRILHTRKIPILDAKGNPAYLLGITEDITERKQVDDSVRLYGQIVENMQIGLYVYHLEDLNDDRTLRAIASNPASTRFTGVEMADILGMTIDEIFPNQRAKGIPQTFAKVIREQKAVELEEIDYDENGAIGRAFSIKAFPLPNHCVGVAFENITTRKQLELELHRAWQQSERSQQLLRTVIDATPDLIFAKDSYFRYILVNQSNAIGMGKNVEEILGKDDVELGFPAEEIFGDPDRNLRGFRADDRAALAGEIVHNPCERVTFADGSLHIFDTQKIPLRDAEGEIFAVLGFAHDITERYLAQEAMRVSEERFRSLVANIPGVVYRCLCDANETMTFISHAVSSLTG
ncbi:MAG: PAS domain-containing protein, partial [Actinomycetota bacterium]